MKFQTGPGFDCEPLSFGECLESYIENKTYRVSGESYGRQIELLEERLDLLDPIIAAIADTLPDEAKRTIACTLGFRVVTGQQDGIL